MDGIELVTRVKKDPTLKSLPVMIMSYKDRAEDRRRGLEAGADHYLTKGMAQVAETGHALQHLALRRLVVIGLDGQRLGFAVDEMRGIARFDPTALKAVPATVARATATYSKAILAWKEHMVGVLDEQLLFYTLERSLA
jgi:CheY-like chemotaxis protein